MAVDNDNHHLVTADVDGVVKVWDITEYALTLQDTPVSSPPGKLWCQRSLSFYGIILLRW